MTTTTDRYRVFHPVHGLRHTCPKISEAVVWAMSQSDRQELRIEDVMARKGCTCLWKWSEATSRFVPVQ